jgi:hypothetical protein
MIAGFVEMLVPNMMNNIAKDRSSEKHEEPIRGNGDAKKKEQP